MPVFVCGCIEGIAAAVGGAQYKKGWNDKKGWEYNKSWEESSCRALQSSWSQTPPQVPAQVPDSDACPAYWFETVPRIAAFHVQKWPKNIDTYVCLDCSARWHKISSKATTAGSGEFSVAGSVDIVEDPATAAHMSTEPLQTWEVRRQCILYSKKTQEFYCESCKVQWVHCE